MSAGQNGRLRRPGWTVLVIESDVQSQLELRSAIRATGLFGLILSAETALIAHDALIEATLDFARFRSDGARDIARIGLANYFAGAAILP